MSSSGGKKSKKNKWKSVALETVINPSLKRPTSSWAEEVESELNDYTLKKLSGIILPTAPRAACDLVIDESKIPQNGPFLAYLSNLPYEVTEDDIVQQFKDLKIVNVQLPKDDRQDRMKGFGYVEFKDKSNLLAALNEGGMTIKGRSVRISLPNDEEQNKERGPRSGSGMTFFRNRDISDRNDRSERALGEWRAGAPVPHDPDKSASRHSVGFTRSQNRDGDRGGSGPFRDLSRTSFQSDSDKSGSQFSRAFRDRDRDWDERDGGRSSDRDRDRDRGSMRPFKRYERDDRMGRSTFGRKFERDDRDIKREPVLATDREEPKTRPKIEIQPRSIPIDANRAPAALPSSIFGEAKPVDTTKREMEIEAKLQTMSTTVRSRGATPPPRLTPMSNRSRSSSVSSLSSARRHEVNYVETPNESNDSSEQPRNDQKEPAIGIESEVVKPQSQDEFKKPENVWEQRSAALSAAAAEHSFVNAAIAPPTVIETKEAEEKASDVAIESTSNEERKSSEVVDEPLENSEMNEEKSKSSNSLPESRVNDKQNWTSYSRDTFETSSQQFGGRHGSSNRFGDNTKYSSFNRDNRRDRRDNHRDRDGERRSDNRTYRNRDDNDRDAERRYDNRNYRNRDDNREGERRSDNRNYRNRDDHYSGNRNDSGAFPNKWSRDGYRNRNSDFGGPGRQDRDNGSGSYNSGRDRNDSRSANSHSFHSSSTSLRDEGEIVSDRLTEKKSQDERLTDSGTHADAVNVDARLEEANDRLKESHENLIPLENGNKNGVERDVIITQSTDNIANSLEQSETNDSLFKTRKRPKKKKHNQEKADKSNQKDIPKSTENDTKAKTQKHEKKNATDNHQSNDKTNKSNAKAKENRNEKQSKKTRDARDDMFSMPKQKEEKTPNFQDTNRFQFLHSDD